jgi:hypothetical protein
MEQLVTLTLVDSYDGAWLCHWTDSNGREAYVACKSQSAADKWARERMPPGHRPRWLKPSDKSRVTSFIVP